MGLKAAILVSSVMAAFGAVAYAADYPTWLEGSDGKTISYKRDSGDYAGPGFSCVFSAPNIEVRMLLHSRPAGQIVARGAGRLGPDIYHTQMTITSGDVTATVPAEASVEESPDPDVPEFMATARVLPDGEIMTAFAKTGRIAVSSGSESSGESTAPVEIVARLSKACDVN